MSNRNVIRKNADIRDYAKAKNVYLYEVAEQLGYSFSTAFTRDLQRELSADRKAEVIAIIDSIAKSR
jgi:uncharacterized tellurite resistance protein B-like protein